MSGSAFLPTARTLPPHSPPRRSAKTSPVRKKRSISIAGELDRVDAEARGELALDQTRRSA